METKKDPMEVLKQEVQASKMLDSYFCQLIKEKGGLSVEDIQEIMADYVMKHSTAEELVDELELEHIRVCSECGKPMYEGYCIEDGAEYYCSDECMHNNLSDKEFEKLYDEGRGNSYWTSWLD
jgi:hypothetical protein